MMEAFNHFVDLVHSMREAQRRYFKTRTALDLVEAKRAERLVDLMLLDFDRSQVVSDKPRKD